MKAYFVSHTLYGCHGEQNEGYHGENEDEKRCHIRVTVQSPLGFATLDKAAALALATSRAVTDLRQYINSDLKICFFCSK